MKEKTTVQIGFLLISIIFLLLIYSLASYIDQFIDEVNKKTSLVTLNMSYFSWFFLSFVWGIAFVFTPLPIWGEKSLKYVKFRKFFAVAWPIFILLAVVITPIVIRNHIGNMGYERCRGHPQEILMKGASEYVYQYKACLKIDSKPE